MDHVSRKLEPLIKHYSLIHQNSEDVYWITYRDFRYAKYISPAMEKTWGYHGVRKKILKDCREWDKHVLLSDLKNHHPFLEMQQKIKREGPLARYHETYRVLRPDGRVRWILDKGHPLYDQSGELLGVTGVAIDISILKEYGPLPTLKSPDFSQHNPRAQFYLRGQYKNIYLTLSEAKCAFFLLQGKTAKQIAQVLTLSPRTVEETLCNIKRKLGVIYRSDLCEALIEGDFPVIITDMT